MSGNYLKNWQEELRGISRPEKIGILSSFFKTGPGEYGEGDVFIGVTVPDNRDIAKKYYDSPSETILEMLSSPIHEFRLSALLAMVHRYKKAKTDMEKSEIIDFYVENCHFCNNWDLVDLSAPYLLGEEFMKGRKKDALDLLSASDNLWHRRIAVVSTLAPTRRNSLDEALRQCELHIDDKELLMHKAVGWVLREVGKKSRNALDDFLSKNIGRISATTLSYATEHFDKDTRRQWQVLRKKATGR